jgi:hypothetical protein
MEDYRKSYELTDCYICEASYYYKYMEERGGQLFCERCAKIPPYTDALYNGIVGFQRLFRAYLAAKGKPCGNCKKLCLKTHDYFTDKQPICSICLEYALDDERRERECPCCYSDPCHCDDGSWWCDKCEGEWGCVCAEIKDEKELARHRRVCRDKQCDGTCGVLLCGCIDVCRDGHDRDYYY